MKTWEVVKALTDNPKLEFKRVSDGVMYMTGEKIHLGVIVDTYLRGGKSAESPLLSDEWELVPQLVSFMDAVKAYSEGKTVESKQSCYTRTYNPHITLNSWMRDQNGNGLSCSEILQSTWYICE